MLTGSCADGLCLLAAYAAALSAFEESEQPWFFSVAPSNPALNGVVTAKEEVQLACLAARQAYWDHVESHGCRPQLVEVPLRASA